MYIANNAVGDDERQLCALIYLSGTEDQVGLYSYICVPPRGIKTHSGDTCSNLTDTMSPLSNIYKSIASDHRFLINEIFYNFITLLKTFSAVSITN